MYDIQKDTMDDIQKDTVNGILKDTMNGIQRTPWNRKAQKDTMNDRAGGFAARRDRRPVGGSGAVTAAVAVAAATSSGAGVGAGRSSLRISHPALRELEAVVDKRVGLAIKNDGLYITSKGHIMSE